MRRVLRLTGLGGAVLGLTTCGDPQEPAPPTPGWVNVVLTTPNADDGGVLFTVGGASVDSVRAAGFPATFVRREGPSSFRVVVVGSLVSGPVAQVFVPDTRSPPVFTFTVLEAAARGTFIQRPLAGYSLGLAP